MKRHAIIHERKFPSGKSGFKFLEAWFGGQAGADIDASGDLGVGDIFRYLSLYFVGCEGF